MSDEEIVEALLVAFDKAKLSEMMRFRMGRTLEEIATGDNLREIVVKVVDFYRRRGEIWALLVQAALANPNNEQLAALVMSGVRTQSRAPQGGSHMENRRNYNLYSEDDLLVLSNLVSELSRQVQALENTFARWETAAKYSTAASEKRIQAIEKDIEAIHERQKAIDKEIALIGTRSYEPRQLALTSWQYILLAMVGVCLPLITGISLYMAIRGG